MKRHLAPLVCLALSACALFQRPPRPVHASPEEAAQVSFPAGLPTEGRQRTPGTTLKAIQLAMDDFLPWDARPPRDADTLAQCLYKRESYDVLTAPGSEDIMFVSITPNPEVCDIGGPPLLDVGATYAIDVRGWRILAVQQ